VADVHPSVGRCDLAKLDQLVGTGIESRGIDERGADTEGTLLLLRPVTDIVNASATYKAPGGHWELTVGGTNLTNVRYIVTGQAQIAGGQIYGTYNRPAEWYARLGFKF